jgi:PAS domain S-box-containing protein
MQSASDCSVKERRCRRILNRTLDYVVVVDESGVIDYVSSAVERLLGFSPDELVGTDAFEYVHQDDQARVRDDFETKLANPGVETSVTYRVQTKEGDYRWVEAKGRNYFDDPVIDGVLLSVRDFTERKRKIEELTTERDTRSALQTELASATSIPAFATTVCEALTAMDAITFAEVLQESQNDPAETIAAAGERPEPGGGGAQENVTLPVEYEGITRGTLVANVDPSLEEEARSTELLAESADLLGYAIADEERRRALAAEKWVQVTLTVDSADTPLSRAVATAGNPVTVTAILPHDDRDALCYLVPDERDQFLEAARETPGIDRVRPMGDERVQAVVTDPCPGDIITDHGGELERARVEATTSIMTVRFPDGMSFDPVLEALSTQFSDVSISEFTTDATQPDEDGDPLAGLTDRQREVLEVAYQSGYFEKPRSNDAAAVAETLGIARPTYDEILRAAHRNLLEELFGSD